MPKTLVNIVTDDNPIPAYLFIKEKYEPGDRLMFISALSTQDDLAFLAGLFSLPQDHIVSITLRQDNDEITYEKICRIVRSRLEQEADRNIQYHVNLAGGTRYMALAVQRAFERYDTTYFYVHVDKNLIVQTIYDDSINDDDDRFYPIRHRMTVKEYLDAHALQHNLDTQSDFHGPIRSEEEVTRFYKLFAGQKLGSTHRTLELLRTNYRNRRSINIAEAEATGCGGPQLPNLSESLRRLGFIPQEEGILNKRELEYLTGGWFEEYVYYLVRKNFQPQDIVLNVTFASSGMDIHRTCNEMDVVFTKGNKLFVIECKTGVETQARFNEIVYKLCALREALLGLSCHSYIFSLKQDTPDSLLKRIASNMGSTFVDRTLLTSPDKIWLRLVWEKMSQEASEA